MRERVRGGEEAENEIQSTTVDISRRQEENTFYFILFLIY